MNENELKELAINSKSSNNSSSFALGWDIVKFEKVLKKMTRI